MLLVEACFRGGYLLTISYSQDVANRRCATLRLRLRLRVLVFGVLLLVAPNSEYECMVPKRMRECRACGGSGWKVRAEVPAGAEMLPLARRRHDTLPEEQRQRRKPTIDGALALKMLDHSRSTRSYVAS